MNQELLFLLAPILPGCLLRGRARLARLADIAIMLAIYALLFLLGVSLGSDEALFAILPTLGLNGMTLGLFCCLGSAALLRCSQNFFLGRKNGSPELAEGAAPAPISSKRELFKSLQGSLIILGLFVLGLVLGRLQFVHPLLRHPLAVTWALRAMLFFVGLSLGFNIKAFNIIRDFGPKLLCVPLLIALGSALGALAATLVLPSLSVTDSMCAASGLGYYSLSSVLLTQLGNPLLGSIALLSNVFREIFSLIATPLLARLLGPLAPLASAGATSMDTCLPSITRFCGRRYGIIAVFSGVILTMAVPLLVPFIYALLKG